MRVMVRVQRPINNTRRKQRTDEEIERKGETETENE